MPHLQGAGRPSGDAEASALADDQQDECRDDDADAHEVEPVPAAELLLPVRRDTAVAREKSDHGALLLTAAVTGRVALICGRKANSRTAALM